ncbi:MAG: MlaE family lipid ABC transporter permease subunit [Candidatus Magnetomorum sp.]|nr:MlaE family lipid ABC transporter permease subunit [Candidatus Magnetomorum sp.]
MFKLSGRLDVNSCGNLWKTIFDRLSPDCQNIQLDVSQLTYCDMSGISLFLAIQSFARKNKQPFEIVGLSSEMSRLFTRFSNEPAISPSPEKTVRTNIAEKTGRFTYFFILDFLQSLMAHIAFVGELFASFFQAIRHPSQVRWKDVWLVAEKSGVNALPIVSLIGFLMGLILAFQSVVPMSKFGAEIFVADLIGLSMIRELGPLMTAIVLAGRTGSAFAAELGAMKVNEEIDALTTMGLDPINFLVVVRVMAAVLVTPLLTIYSDVISVIGGAIPLVSMGYPIVTYYNGVVKAVDYLDLLSGLYKSVFFGLLVASSGCMCGLQTRTGAGAVGESTTRAVVNSIVLIVLCDGLFSVMFYYLGI